MRCDTLEELSRFPEEEVLYLIVDMLKDKNYLVRCEACDALYNFKSEDILYKLVDHIKKEKSSTVRMYAISTICHIMKQVNYNDDLTQQLKKMYIKEKSKRVIISYQSMMYLIEREPQYIVEALAYLNDTDYHIRCNVVNLLGEVIDDEVVKLVCSEYKKRLLIENAKSVKILLEEEVNRLCHK